MCNYIDMFRHVTVSLHMSQTCAMTYRLALGQSRGITHMCHMSHSYAWHDSFVCATWLIHMCGMTYSPCDMTLFYVRHDAFICVTWLIHMCAITHSCVWHFSFICVTWPIHKCGITHSKVHHDTFTCKTWLFHTYIRMSHGTHILYVTNSMSYQRHQSSDPWVTTQSYRHQTPFLKWVMTHMDPYEWRHKWFVTHMEWLIWRYEWVMTHIS